jgi:3-dehydroquinate dehydratase II
MSIKKMKILIINGPNLNLLGRREPHIYGSQTFEDYLKILKAATPAVKIEYFQSNHEGDLLDKLHAIGFNPDYLGVVLNAGALTHTSIALADAIGGIEVPVIEVHISNVHKREAFRHHSFIASKCVGSVVGLGLKGYQLAIEYLMTK